MTFVPKSFSNGAVLPALDLNEMDGNDDHVREEANYSLLWCLAATTLVRTLSSISVRLYLDGTAIGTAFTTTGEKSDPDIDISAVAEGLHVLTIRAGNTDFYDVNVRFYKSPDLERITWWVRINAVTGTSGNYTHSIANVTVLGHRESKSWT